jgi:hypothetical protein
VAVFSVAALLASCGSDGSAAALSADGVVGTWTARGGSGVLTFRADHSFVSDRLRITSALIHGCPAGRAAGTWGFFAHSEMSDTARTGSTVGLVFSRAAGPDCVTLDLDVRRDAGRTSLCVTDDPDAPCAVGVRFRRTGTTAG